ncbi:hypothetical protein AB0M48_25450 [Lentzea sp. NPDC051208]|uniref:hypothetical protein n=1 Tax=Lentzea sp. NPDC051208 TaxID=3154642 RepID=UPI00341B331E
MSVLDLDRSVRAGPGWWDDAVHYNEVEQVVRELVTAAADEKRHRFGAETVVRLTTGGDLADAAEAEFDGDMEPQVLWALEALEHWASFLVDRGPEFVVQLAIRSLEAVDHEVSAPLDDFLASAEMAAEFDRIGRRLRQNTATTSKKPSWKVARLFTPARPASTG